MFRVGAMSAVIAAVAATFCGCALLFLFPEQPYLALTPAVAGLALFLLLRLPLRTSVLVLFTLVLALHSPQDRPADGLWTSPLELLGALLTKNLNAMIGARMLPFSLVDALTALLLIVAFNRRSLGSGLPKPMLAAALLFLAALGAFAVHGLGSGGNFDAAYWQVRQLVFIPVFAVLFAAALRGQADVGVVCRIIIGTALLKAAVGLFFFVAIAKARGLSPAYLTTHSDSMHFVLALALLGIRWLEAPTRRHFAQGLLLAPALLALLVLNDRRLAWIGVFGVIAIAVAFARRTFAKRKVLRFALALVPLFAVYTAAGWNQKGAAFRPVQTLRSMVASEEDSSTRWRDFENFNLAATVRRAPLFGQGLGLPYDEVVRAPSIARDFELWKHIPHNSVLWLLTVGGLVGFAALLWLFWANSYFAARTLRLSETPDVRIGAVLALCATFVFLVQCFGDMGTQSWTTVSLFAVVVAQCGRLSEAVQPWRSARRAQIQIPTLEHAR